MQQDCDSTVIRRDGQYFVGWRIRSTGYVYVMRDGRCATSGRDLTLDGMDQSVGVERLGDEATGAVGEHGVTGLFLAIG